MATAQWIKEAEEQARKYSDAIKQNNQYLIEQLNAAKQNSLDELQKKQENALYNLNTNESTINQNAVDNAKQLNVNRLLALKSNEQAMNRAGLGTQGIVGSQVNSINNNYGTNLASVLNNKTNQLNDLARQKNDLNTNYDTNRLNLLNQYEANLANLQNDIDTKALNEYNTIYNNYLALKQQEYENEQAEKAREEAIRQWNAQYALNKANSNRSYSSSGSSVNPNNFSETETTQNNSFDGLGNSLETQNKSDYYWKNSDGSYTTQPAYVNNTRLKASGKTAKDIGVAGNGIGNSYRVWQANGKYYVWNSNLNTYMDVTDEFNGTNGIGGKFSSGAGNGGGNNGSRGF